MGLLSWLFTDDSSSDRDPARWGSAVHEASHVVAARRRGGRATAKVKPGGGSFSGSLPDSATDVDEAVVLLAGGDRGETHPRGLLQQG